MKGAQIIGFMALGAIAGLAGSSIRHYTEGPPGDPVARIAPACTKQFGQGSQDEAQCEAELLKRYFDRRLDRAARDAGVS